MAMLTGLPASRAEALRHFSLVEVGLTPILDILCFKGLERSRSALLNNYKRLTEMIHPVKVTRVEILQAQKFMLALVRAFELV